MEIYQTIAEWTGWPPIVAILLAAIGFGYFGVRSRLELQKERIDWLEKQLEVANQYRPDILAQRLAERLRLASQELEQLNADHEGSTRKIKEKESQLESVRSEISDLQLQLESAEEILTLVKDRELVCPHCGSPLVVHEFYPDMVEYQGRDIDFEHETTAYECGHEIVDGRITSQCPNASGGK
jgi:DNA repair exonuclease SbcCD ATPase subunit